MSNRYEASIRSAAAPAAAAAFLEIRNIASRRLLIEEIGITLGAATATGIGLVRATAQGTGGATTATGQPEDPSAPAATPTVAVNAFTAAPTFTAANTMRRLTLPGAIGAGLIWTWPQSDRLVVPASGSIVLYNSHTAAGAAGIEAYVIWTE